ncbi:hypothetical protein SPBR_00263 [Sporothrix brasiliensis 5110]|uniref:N,N-dimethylformamidase beta subunit-like C-terminal domain-containing protein n=1 Tax=Sporothrix brasiliensis 5110 TaxID=1398154 RepID=A0A0C2FFD8_9PEZI|nr:uncharacterized protein SPBR_00263 [Sporothrix brasiliensis 5110]KIH89833.1 hypothetical protein SPBR_00263 [Sporothrix brasiliensis 5110]
MALQPDKDYPVEIIGYAEPWIAAPEPEYTYRTVRLIQGIDLEHSPKKVEEEVTAIPRGKQPGRFQSAHPGSYGRVTSWCPPGSAGGVQVSFYVQPWLLACPHDQTLVSALDEQTKTGFSITLGTKGSLDFRVGNGDNIETVATGLQPALNVWAKVKLVIQGSHVKLDLAPTAFRAEAVPAATSSTSALSADARPFTTGPLLVAAAQGDGKRAADFFNGRIDSLSIKALESATPRSLAQYDFSLDMQSNSMVDTSGHGRHGTLINAPTRALPGYNWDGSENDWTKAKYGYGAIHFHDDDMDDADWATDFTVTIPETARSGAYAVEVATESSRGKDSDSIVFFVRPNQWSAPETNKDKVCLVFSTMTYLAYANERLYDKTRVNTADLGPGFDIDKTVKSGEFYKMRRRTDMGLSTYDRHNDSSGVCFSTAKRPILNMRPGYVMWAFSRPREFSADLFMVGLLEQQGIPYEILTDHDLHARGASALHGFAAVMTGCHPEYPTLQSFGAYNAYARAGGCLMYMGGNGFYWVGAVNNHHAPHRLEIRRGDVGVRPYSLHGGEHVTCMAGQRGGLWRSRGLSCNTLFGVGFCAQGTGLGVPFRRTEASREPQFQWIFDGVTDEAADGPDGPTGAGLFGVAGFGGGASGDEIDRFDTANGSPAAAVVLASSTGHSDEFGIAIEDLSYPALNTLGTQTDRIRSDVVYYKTTGGGAVFSVGSINWYCSLAWDAYDNNVARLTLNVVRGFLSGRHKG